MYGFYNAETVGKLVSTINKMHNGPTRNRTLFSARLSNWDNWHLSEQGLAHFTINSISYLNTLKINILNCMITVYKCWRCMLMQ